jgi:hypothetical protein
MIVTGQNELPFDPGGPFGAAGSCIFDAPQLPGDKIAGCNVKH